MLFNSKQNQNSPARSFHGFLNVIKPNSKEMPLLFHIPNIDSWDLEINPIAEKN
jgi:hypothetical protein